MCMNITIANCIRIINKASTSYIVIYTYNDEGELVENAIEVGALMNFLQDRFIDLGFITEEELIENEIAKRKQDIKIYQENIKDKHINGFEWWWDDYIQKIYQEIDELNKWLEHLRSDNG